MLRRGRMWLAMVCVLCAPVVGRAQTDNVERVGGRVVSERDGRPLVHATVSLTNLKGEKEAATVFSDAEGRFRFPPVSAGKYRLTGSLAHYIANSYMGHDGFSTAIVTGAGLATGDLTLRLVPTSALYGRVLDDAGAPVERAIVTLYREDLTTAQPVREERTIQTDEDGGFEFVGLRDGRYFVSASGTPWYAVHARRDEPGQRFLYRTAVDPALDVAYAMVFYPNAADSGGAEAIPLHGGDEVTIDLRLHAEPAMTLTVKMPPAEVGANGQRMQQFPQLSHKVFGQDEPVNMQSDYHQDGTQTITGIPAGRYTVAEFFNGSAFPVNTQEVDLNHGPVALEASTSAELATVQVKVRGSNGTTVPTRTQVSLRSSHSNRNGSMVLNDKGVAKIEGVPPGEYSFNLYGDGRPLTVSSVAVDGKAVPDKRLVVTGKGVEAAELTVSSAAVDVEGFVKRAGMADAGAMVVLVPAGEDTSEGLFRRDQSDLDGSFTLPTVVPGNYILVAIDDGWTQRWNDVGVMAKYLSRGVPVTVKSAGTVHLADAVVAQAR